MNAVKPCHARGAAAAGVNRRGHFITSRGKTGGKIIHNRRLRRAVRKAPLRRLMNNFGKGISAVECGDLSPLCGCADLSAWGKEELIVAICFASKSRGGLLPPCRQQAAMTESGDKSPHSKALRARKYLSSPKNRGSRNRSEHRISWAPTSPSGPSCCPEATGTRSR